MTYEEVRELVRALGANGKLVRAIVRRMGWPRGVGGEPDEWHVAFRGWLGDMMERALREAAP